MVESKSTSRLPSIDSSIVLLQTDTTVGFISQNKEKLYKIKSRDTNKPFIEVYSNFKTLLNKKRLPPKQKNFIRRAKKTTFIVKGKAFRVAKTSLNSQTLRDSQWNYSTSANESGKNFDLDFCEDKTDIMILDKYGLEEKSSSSLFKINNNKKARLR